MNELSLFSGAGGGVLGSKILGWRTVGYVEKDEYCQNVLRQRIFDGILGAAPIWGDIRWFIRGAAYSFDNLVDIITAGFPCQPFSIAGKRSGEKDARNMWPETIECIRIVRPKYALLENVPGLLQSDYFGRILGDLAQSGYDATWTVLGASDVGANHKRKRLWILAYSRLLSKGGSECRGDDEGTSGKPSGRSETLGNADSKGELQSKGAIKNKRGRIEYPGWWKTEPAMGRVVDGVADRIHRLKAIGNGQVPLTMAFAFSKLFERIN